MLRIILALCLIFPCFSFANIEKANEIYNISEQYDKYYEGGKDSIYQKRYNDTFIANERNIILTNINDFVEKNSDIKQIRVLDFGAGDGRMMKIFIEAAENLKAKNIKLEVVAYDISIEGLKFFENKLIKNNFSLTTPSIILSNFRKYSLSKLVKDNISFILVEGKSSKLSMDLIPIIGKVDKSFSIFGVYGHINPKEERIDTLKFLKAITNDKIIISVPSYRILEPDYQVFKYLHEKRFALPFLNNFEKGDLFYTRPVEINGEEKFLHIFFHLFDSQEIKNDLKLAKLELVDNEIKIEKIFHQVTLLNYPMLGKLDMYLSKILSKILPESMINKVAGYYLIEAK